MGTLRDMQKKMPNDELLRLCRIEEKKLRETNGRSLRMCVPPNIYDTDMLLNELFRRFEELDGIQKAIAEIEAKFDEALKDCAKANERGMIRYNGMATAYAESVVIIGKHFPSLAQEWDSPTQD
jgi:hypothetical protein